MTKKRKKTTDQNTAGKPTQSTPKESLWSKWPSIPKDDPIFKSGFVIGERRSIPLSRKGTRKKS